jgi:hypothetical protein
MRWRLARASPVTGPRVGTDSEPRRRGSDDLQGGVAPG